MQIKLYGKDVSYLEMIKQKFVLEKKSQKNCVGLSAKLIRIKQVSRRLHTAC